MWKHRLLSERGSAPLEAIASILVLTFMCMAVVQIALTLYARNALIAAAHEGARAMVELGRSADEGVDVARTAVERATGDLAGSLQVEVATHQRPAATLIEVRIQAEIRPLGPIPFYLPVTARASALRERL